MLTRAMACTAILLTPTFIYAAGDEPTPPAIQVSAEPAMPLTLYRSLKKKLAAVSDNAATLQKAAVLEQGGGDEEQKKARDEAAAAAQTAVQELQAEVQQNEEQLLRSLSSREDLQRQMGARVLAFATDKKRAVQALIPLMKDADADVRTASAVSLGLLSDATAAEALIGALRDEDEHVRLRSAEALGAIRDDQAVRPLLKALEQESEPEVRMQAAIALGRIKSGVKAADLDALLTNETDERVRMAIAAAMKIVSGSDLSLDAIPDQNDFKKRLEALSEDMGGLRDKLRNDRHDETVQLEGKDVERKLQDMIDELQRMNQAAQMQRKQAQQQDRMKQASASSSQSGAQPDGSGGNGADAEGRVHPSEVVAQQERWASLPPRERDELLQIYRPEIPSRWRKRLEAYFVSVAAEEAAQRKRKTESSNDNSASRDQAP